MHENLNKFTGLPCVLIKLLIPQHSS